MNEDPGIALEGLVSRLLAALKALVQAVEQDDQQAALADAQQLIMEVEGGQ